MANTKNGLAGETGDKLADMLIGRCERASARFHAAQGIHVYARENEKGDLAQKKNNALAMWALLLFGIRHEARRQRDYGKQNWRERADAIDNADSSLNPVFPDGDIRFASSASHPCPARFMPVSLAGWSIKGWPRSLYG